MSTPCAQANALLSSCNLFHISSCDDLLPSTTFSRTLLLSDASAVMPNVVSPLTLNNLLLLVICLLRSSPPVFP